MILGRQDKVAVFVIPDRDVPVPGQAQSSEGTDESGVVVMVRDGIETLVQLALGSQGLDYKAQTALADREFPVPVGLLPSKLFLDVYGIDFEITEQDGQETRGEDLEDRRVMDLARMVGRAQVDSPEFHYQSGKGVGMMVEVLPGPGIGGSGFAPGLEKPSGQQRIGNAVSVYCLQTRGQRAIYPQPDQVRPGWKKFQQAFPPPAILGPGVEAFPSEPIFVDCDQAQTGGGTTTGIACIDTEETFSHTHCVYLTSTTIPPSQK